MFDFPKEIYILELTDLPYYIDINDKYKYKYLLNIIDDFSKLTKSYLESSRINYLIII